MAQRLIGPDWCSVIHIYIYSKVKIWWNEDHGHSLRLTKWGHGIQSSPVFRYPRKRHCHLGGPHLVARPGYGRAPEVWAVFSCSTTSAESSLFFFLSFQNISAKCRNKIYNNYIGLKMNDDIKYQNNIEYKKKIWIPKWDLIIFRLGEIDNTNYWQEERKNFNTLL